MKTKLLVLGILMSGLIRAWGASNEILVTNAAEFLNAIGSNRTLILAAGDYDLSAETALNGDHFNFRKHGAGRELYIFGVRNLRIQGQKGAVPHLWTQPGFGTVVNFEQCQQLHIEGLRAGHGPVAGYCTGGVLDFENCEDVVVRDCQLYGSGNQGFRIQHCTRFLSTNNVIKECSISIMALEGATHIFFSGCTFQFNKGIEQVIVRTSTDITFKDCIFQANCITLSEGRGTFFDIDEGSMVALTGGAFVDNVCNYFGPSKKQVKVKNVTMGEKNSFLKGFWESSPGN